MKALKKKYKVTTFDPKLKNYNLISKNKFDVILMLYMERRVEYSTSYFEYLRIPYTHSGVISSIMQWIKLFQKIFIENNILTPKYFNSKAKWLSKTV